VRNNFHDCYDIVHLTKYVTFAMTVRHWHNSVCGIPTQQTHTLPLHNNANLSQTAHLGELVHAVQPLACRACCTRLSPEAAAVRNHLDGQILHARVRKIIGKTLVCLR
jgi:hypothetical protein